MTLVCQISDCGLPTPVGRCARCQRPFCLSHYNPVYDQTIIAGGRLEQVRPIGPETLCTDCANHDAADRKAELDARAAEHHAMMAPLHALDQGQANPLLAHLPTVTLMRPIYDLKQILGIGPLVWRAKLYPAGHAWLIGPLPWRGAVTPHPGVPDRVSGPLVMTALLCQPPVENVEPIHRLVAVEQNVLSKGHWVYLDIQKRALGVTGEQVWARLREVAAASHG